MKLIQHMLILGFVSLGFSQNQLKGVILTQENSKQIPLQGANVYWLNSEIGTITSELGVFSIPYTEQYKKLIISYVGFKTDTLEISKNVYVKHLLKPEEDLNEVTITSRKKATQKSYLKATNTFTVSSDELLKAACCNLSESFETNPSIDVNFADAISGTRQIKMLGLTSPYILINTENIPSVRGASQTYGLSFIPGTWVESIQVTKGAGSVVNGFESIAGQINTELVKPASDNDIFVNLFAANSQRVEINTHFNTQLSEKLHTGFYIHGNTHQEKHDVNNDGFLDMPLYNQINILNRWQYTNAKKGIVSFLNLRYLNDSKQAGQVSFNPESDRGTTNFWGSEIDTERFEVTSKFGFVNPELPYQSLGLQSAYSFHKQSSYFGLQTYNIKHSSLYSNLIYNSIISDSRHKIKTGISFTLDSYDEVVNNEDFDRVENSVGGFFEYAFDDLDKLTITSGLRLDYHNRFGVFITPRLHLRYSPWGKSAIRFSAGRGIRSANIFAENQNIFSSSRQINIQNSGGKIYGLDPEIAWNFGFSYLQGFNLFGRSADVTLDFYRTNFENQVVVDWENPSEINFYNLDGKSYANSFQLEINYNPFEHFDVRTAYKFYDVKTTYQSGQLAKPLLPKHRFFINLGYKTHVKENSRRWKFDATYNWLGAQRFPGTSESLSAYNVAKFTPHLNTVNMQITKVFSENFELYFGAENLTNVRQQNPIINPSNPFADNFDTNFIYGPIFGGMYYTGLRFKIKQLKTK